MIEEGSHDPLTTRGHGLDAGGLRNLTLEKMTNKSNRGSSLSLLPCDVLHYILTSFAHIKDVLRLDSAWTVRGERESCWLPALCKLFGRCAALLETGKSDLLVSETLSLHVSREWMLRGRFRFLTFRPGEHDLSEVLDRLSYLSVDSLRSFNLDYTSMSCWLRANALPVPSIDNIIFSANELRATQYIRCTLGNEREIPNQRVNLKRAFRRILIKDNPPIREVIALGLVPRFVEFLHRSDNPILQYEAAWALTNIAASSRAEHTQCVIDAGAVPIFVKLLASPHQDVCEQAAWALGNVAGDSVSSRDVVLQHGALPALIELGTTFSDDTPLSLVRIVSWTLSLLCRLQPAPHLNLVSPALPLLARLIHSKDEDTVRDTCWALYYLTMPDNANGIADNERIEAVMQSPQLGLSRLTELLQDELLSKSHSPAIKTVGNIVGATASQHNTVQLVVNAGLVPTLVELLRFTDEFGDIQEAIWILTNCTSEADSSQAEHLVCEGVVPPMCKLLRHSVLFRAALEGLENILLKVPTAVRAVKECEGDKMLRALTTLPIKPELGHASISSRAAAIIETYFSGGGGD